MAAQDLPHDDTDMQASTADDKEGSRDSEAKHDGGGARGSGVSAGGGWGIGDESALRFKATANLLATWKDVSDSIIKGAAVVSDSIGQHSLRNSATSSQSGSRPSSLSAVSQVFGVEPREAPPLYAPADAEVTSMGQHRSRAMLSCENDAAREASSRTGGAGSASEANDMSYRRQWYQQDAAARAEREAELFDAEGATVVSGSACSALLLSAAERQEPHAALRREATGSRTASPAIGSEATDGGVGDARLAVGEATSPLTGLATSLGLVNQVPLPTPRVRLAVRECGVSSRI